MSEEWLERACVVRLSPITWAIATRERVLPDEACAVHGELRLSNPLRSAEVIRSNINRQKDFGLTLLFEAGNI